MLCGCTPLPNLIKASFSLNEVSPFLERAVASKRTNLTIKTTRRRYVNIFGQVYDKTLIVMIVTEVGGDETEVGYGRVPAFANAPES